MWSKSASGLSRRRQHRVCEHRYCSGSRPPPSCAAPPACVHGCASRPRRKGCEPCCRARSCLHLDARAREGRRGDPRSLQRSSASDLSAREGLMERIYRYSVKTHIYIYICIVCIHISIYIYMLIISIRSDKQERDAESFFQTRSSACTCQIRTRMV